MTEFKKWSLASVLHLGIILCPGMILMPGIVAAEAAFVPEETVTVTRGITGRILVESEHGFVRGRPDLDLESPILVRVAKVRVGSEGEHLSELEFIGTDVGEFDLRSVLVFDDGGPIDRIGPQMIEVISNLSADAPSDVFLAEAPPASIGGGYRSILWAIGAAWLLVPVVVVIGRSLRRPPPPTEVIPPPTIAEKIAPLVELAATRELTVPEQGRLELLLYAHWQARLGLGPDRVDAVAVLRRHDVAGRLLRAIESWLHAPRRTPPSRQEITELLAPYLTPVSEGNE
ncbi:MAG: hypothetical protein P8J59_08965 [Phycisphaerales bacterium]|nr:hypothetical protein [Phycisphaerales bacterium]